VIRTLLARLFGFPASPGEDSRTESREPQEVGENDPRQSLAESSPPAVTDSPEIAVGSKHLELIAGLGNPGSKYDHTRHNVGFMVLDELAGQAGLSFGSERKWEADAMRTGGVLYLKPKTYMNDSGRAVVRAAHFHKIEPARILVLCDDVSLPLGSVRLRRGGSSGGHNGLKSVAAVLGTEKFPRLRIGVGRGSAEAGEHRDELVSHVLGRFSEEERSALEQAIGKAIEAIRLSLSEGLDAAMTQFNRKVPSNQKSQADSSGSTTDS